MVKNEPIYIESLDQFMEWTLALGSEQYLFRGVSNECYDIGEASTYRRLSGENNKTIAKLLEINRNLIEQARRQEHDKINDSQLSDLELLGKLQHFRAATFLIDFTNSAQVALWFACEINSKESVNGKVAAVRNSPYGIKEILGDNPNKEIGDFFKPDEDESYPLYQWQPTSIDNRIVRQHSVFLFGGAKIVADAECIISKELKKNIRDDLEKFSSISADTLFPDFDGFVRQNAHDIVYGNIRDDLEKFSSISADTLFPDFDGFVRQNAHDIVYDIPDYRGIAERAFLRSDYTEAIANYNSAIRLDSDNANLYISRGRVKREIKQYEEAITDFSNAIRLNPKIPYSYYWRGLTNFTIEQYEESIADYNTAISIFSDDSLFYYQRGISKYHLEEYSNAIDDFDIAIRISPKSSYYYCWRGVTKKKLGELDKAKTDLELGLLLANEDNNDQLITYIQDEIFKIEDYDDIPF